MTTVYVVDDDESVRRALGRLLKSAGIEAHVFASAEEFLQSDFHAKDACLVTDLRMPGMSGLDLQQELRKRHIDIPVVFVTAFDSDEARTQARLAGAAGYFSLQGNMDFCITIRTLLIKENTVYIQAGAGIVADSVPEKEWTETKNKARGLMEAYRVSKNI